MDLFRHRKDTKIKIEFHISALSLTNLPESSSGKEYSVEIKRGSKIRNSGVTKKASVRNGTVHWADGEATVVVTGRFYQDPTTKKLSTDKKDITIILKEDEPTKRRSIISFGKITKKDTIVLGKSIINMSNYTDPGSIRSESIQIVCPERKMTYHLNIKIETKWVKIDNKKLVKKTAETPHSSGIKVGDEDFVLQTTDEVSETNTSVSSDRVSDIDEDDISANFEDSWKNTSIDRSPSLKNLTSPKKKRNEMWEIDGDTFLSAIRISSNVGACHGLKLRRTLSESVLPVYQGKLEHPSGNLGMKTKFEDLRGKFDKELKSLKERFEGELRLQQKEKEKQVKRLLEDKKRLEESLTKIEDIKIKLETSAYDLQRKLDAESKEKLELVTKLEKMNSKTAKKDSNMKKKEIEEKLVKYEKEVTSLNQQIQQLKQDNQKFTQKSTDDEKEIARLTEKTTKLSKNIVDQEVVIQDLEEQLKEFGEKFRDAMESQEAATEELIKEKGKNLELQSRVDEEQTRREYLSKVDLIEAYETQYKFQRFWKLHAIIIVLAFFICLMADNLV